MSLQIGRLFLCLLVTRVTVCEGLHVSITRTPDAEFCAHLQCDVDVNQTDRHISYIIGLSIYNLTWTNTKEKLASVSVFEPELYIYQSKDNVLNGTASITRSQGHLSLSFQDVTDCLHGSFLCELDFMNVSGQPDVITESTDSGDSHDCSLLEDQLRRLAAKVDNLTSNTQAELEVLKQEIAVLEGNVTLLTSQNTALQSTLDHVVQRLAVIEAQCNSSVDQPHVLLTCSKGMSYNSSRQVFPLWGRVPALCDTETDGGGWVIIQRRTKGDVDFYRSWADYKNGFGTPDTDYWIGLDVIHNLTSQGYNELRFDLEYQGNNYYAHYSNFSVADELSNYRLTVSGYNGTAGDSFTRHSGYSFSTYDRDNDGDTNFNCSSRYHGAWWYYNCYSCNLNGLWASYTDIGVTWNGIVQSKSLDSTEMKVRSSKV